VVSNAIMTIDLIQLKVTRLQNSFFASVSLSPTDIWELA